MALPTKYLMLVGLTVTLAKTIKAANFTCGLKEYNPNGPSNPHILPPVSDDIQSGVRAWETPMFGSIVGENTYIGDHVPYMWGWYDAGLEIPVYFFDANNRTHNFVKEQQTRVMNRTLSIRCEDGNHPMYSFLIPVMDRTPPKFKQHEYFCSITDKWDRQDPISCEEIVDVSDNLSPIEWENENKTLTYSASPDIIEISATRLTDDSSNMTLTFRLEIFVKENARLEAENVVTLSAIDGTNIANTQILITVE